MLGVAALVHGDDDEALLFHEDPDMIPCKALTVRLLRVNELGASVPVCITQYRGSVVGPLATP